jgi:hypothetical protein
MGVPDRTIRGIRDTIPTGYVIGRTGLTDGRAQLLPIKDLGNALVKTGAVASVPQAQSNSGRPADFAVFWPGKPAASQVFLQIKMTLAITLPASLTGSEFSAGIAATSNYVITISKNGSSIGTLTYSSGGVAVSFASLVNLAVGDTFELAGQPGTDATLANIGMSFHATQT